MYLSNGNVVLRDFCAEDIALKVEWINDPRNNQYLHYDIPLDYQRTKAWFMNRDTEKRLDCMIEYDGAPVGLIGLLGIDRMSRKAEFYISMGSHEHKQRGIATAATRMLLQYAFESLMLQKIYLNVDADNQAAIRLYEKIGFQREGYFVRDMLHRGVFIDRVRYAIFRED